MSDRKPLGAVPNPAGGPGEAVSGPSTGRPSGAPGEPPAEHIRNALNVLMHASGNLTLGDNPPITDDAGFPLVVLRQQDYVAIKGRLWTAVNELEAGRCGVYHGLPSGVSQALNSGDGTYRP